MDKIAVIPCQMSNSMLQETELYGLIDPMVYGVATNKKTSLTNVIEFAHKLTNRVIVIVPDDTDAVFDNIIKRHNVEIVRSNLELYSAMATIVDDWSLEDQDITVVYPFMDYSIFTQTEIEDIRKTGNLIVSARNISGKKDSEAESDQRPPLVVSLNEAQVTHVFCDMPPEETLAMVTHIMPVFRFRTNYDETSGDKVKEWVDSYCQDNPDVTNTLKKCSFFAKIRIIHPILR
jgi:hypothetical protein